MASSPATPRGFLEPLWDPDATTAAHNIIFLSKLIQISTNGKVYRDKKIFSAAFPAEASSAVVTDVGKKVGVQVLLFIHFFTRLTAQCLRMQLLPDLLTNDLEECEQSKFTSNRMLFDSQNRSLR